MNLRNTKLFKKDLHLYAITSRYWLDGESLKSQVEKAIKGGITMLQLREKNLDYDEFLKEAIEIKEVCQGKIPFIINDNIKIAKLVDADGVHIGQSDTNILKAREYLGRDKIIGVSAHNLDEAIEAEEKGADYLGVGAVFQTDTKEDAKKIDLGTIKEICEKISIPIVAIGGINKENILELRRTGIDGVALIKAIFSKKDIELSARELKRIIEEEIII